jgi:hypothetical protein
MVSMSLPVAAAELQVGRVEANSSETVAVRATASTQAMMLFTRNDQCLNDAGRGATISGAAGTVLSRNAERYTMHFGEILVTTDSKSVDVATAKGGCTVPAHCRAIVRYRPGSFFETEMVSSEVRKNEKKTFGAPNRMYAQPGSVFTFNANDGVKLIKGRLIVCASSAINVGTERASVNIQNTEYVAIENLKGGTRIQAMNDWDGIAVTTSFGETKLDCGRELFIANATNATCKLLPCDGVGRRVVRCTQSAGGDTLMVSEYSMLGTLKYHAAARALRADGDEESKRIVEDLVKTCAAVECVTQSHGKYVYGTANHSVAAL